MNPSPGLCTIAYLTGVGHATDSPFNLLQLRRWFGHHRVQCVRRFYRQWKSILGGLRVKILGDENLGGALDLRISVPAMSTSGWSGEGHFKSFLASAILCTGGFLGSVSCSGEDKCMTPKQCNCNIIFTRVNFRVYGGRFFRSKKTMMYK
jgi:hypothetical protein